MGGLAGWLHRMALAPPAAALATMGPVQRPLLVALLLPTSAVTLLSLQRVDASDTSTAAAAAAAAATGAAAAAAATCGWQSFPQAVNNTICFGFTELYDNDGKKLTSGLACEAACCANPHCNHWQFAATGSKYDGCWAVSYTHLTLPTKA